MAVTVSGRVNTTFILDGDIVKLIQIRNAGGITAKEASEALNGGVDYTTDPTDVVVKFDLYFDAEGLDSLDPTATEIRGAQFDLDLSGITSQLDNVSDFATENNSTWLMDLAVERGVFDVVILNNAMGNIAPVKASAVVDIDPSNDGDRPPIPMEQKIGTVYINPRDGETDIQLSIQNMVITTDAGEVTPLSYTVTLIKNGPPELLSEISDATLNEDSPYSYDTSNHFADPDPVDVLTYSATLEDGSALPSWLTLDPDTGVLSGTPDNDDSGLYSITMTATDGAGDSVDDTYYLTVENVNDAPILDGDFTGTVTTGAASNTVTGALTGSDVDRYPWIGETGNWTSTITTTVDNVQTSTQTNTRGDQRIVTTEGVWGDGAYSGTGVTTLASGGWYRETQSRDGNGLVTKTVTSSLGDNWVGTNNGIENSWSVTGDLLVLGALYTDLEFTRSVENGRVSAVTGSALSPDGEIVTIGMDGFDEDGDPIIIGTTSGGHGISRLYNDGEELLYTIEDQRGTYGTLALDEQANWIYTLDNSDPDTIALKPGETVVDSFMVELSDGIDAVSQQVDVSVVGEDYMFRIQAPTPLQIDTNDPNIDLGMDGAVIDAIAANVTAAFGHTSVTALSSSWDSDTNTLMISFDSATNDQVPIAYHISTSYGNIIEEALGELGYTEITGLTTGWESQARTATLSFSSAEYSGQTVSDMSATIVTSESGDIVSFNAAAMVTADPITLTQSDITEGTKSALTLMGYSGISGLSSSWNTSENIFDLSISSAYASGYYLTSISMRLDLDNSGNVTSLSASAYNSSAGWIQWDHSTMTEYEKDVIKEAYVVIDTIERLSQVDSSDEVALLMLELAGYSQISGLTTSWDPLHLTSTLEVSSARYGGQSVINGKIVASINALGSIDFYSSTAQVDGEQVSYDRYDLTDEEKFFVILGNHAMARIGGIRDTVDATDLTTAERAIIQSANQRLVDLDSALSNHEFTDGSATISFDLNGSITDYAASLSHSDAGVISFSDSSLLNTTRLAAIDSAYSEIRGVESMVDAILDADSQASAIASALESVGFSQLSGVSCQWDSGARTVTAGFDGGYWDGTYLTAASVVITVDRSGDLIAYDLLATTGAGQFSHSMEALGVVDRYSLKVAAKTVSDLTAIEVAENHASLLDNPVFDLWSSSVDTGVDISPKSSKVGFIEVAEFDQLKLSTTDAYTPDINITDAIDVLRHIVNLDPLTASSSKYHAADVNNDGTINISDAIDVLRHIVSLDTIDSFDLIDEQGNRVTRLDPDALGGGPTWTIVANGDVNLSGSFAEEYTIQSDLV